MFQEIPYELKQKYTRLEKRAAKQFPKGRWKIESTVWDDDSFMLEAIHNRSEFKCKMVVGSDNSYLPSEITEIVQYRKVNKNINYIVFTEDDEIYTME